MSYREEFEKINHLRKYKQSEDNAHWCWGDFERDNFQIWLSKDETAETKCSISMNVFGCTVHRNVYGAGINLSEEFVHSALLLVHLYRYEDACPPKDILKMMNMSKFRIKYDLNYKDVTSLDLEFSNNFKPSDVRVYDTVKCRGDVKTAIDLAYAIDKLCVTRR